MRILDRFFEKKEKTNEEKVIELKKKYFGKTILLSIDSEKRVVTEIRHIMKNSLLGITEDLIVAFLEESDTYPYRVHRRITEQELRQSKIVKR